MLRTSVILMEPENAGNIGAIARVMKNFECSNLILINPLADPLSLEARVRSKHGMDVLEKSKVISSLNELDSFDFLIGTSAHIGGDHNPLRIAISVEEMIGNLRTLSGKIGLLFGREGHGLTNDELNKCDLFVSIPSSPDYSTLNLSHSVGIFLYELYKMKQAVTPNVTLFREANRTELDQLSSQYEAIIQFLNENIKKFNDQRKLDAVRVFTNILGRAFISGREAFTLIGVFRHVLENLAPQ